MIKSLQNIKEHLSDAMPETKDAFNKVVKYLADSGKCPASGCIEKDAEGNWRIISNKTGEYWPAKYESEDKAKEALAAYHATRHFDGKKYTFTLGLVPKSIERKGTQGVGEQFYKSSEVKHSKVFTDFDWSKDTEKIKKWKSENESKDGVKYLVANLQSKEDTGKSYDEWVVYPGDKFYSNDTDSYKYVVAQCLIAKAEGKDVFYIIPYEEYKKLPTHKDLEYVDSGDDKDALIKKWNAKVFEKKNFDDKEAKYQVVVMAAEEKKPEDKDVKFFIIKHKLGSPIMNGVEHKICSEKDITTVVDQLKNKYSIKGKVKVVPENYWSFLDSLGVIHEELMDASPGVKSAFNEVVKYFSGKGKGYDEEDDVEGYAVGGEYQPAGKHSGPSVKNPAKFFRVKGKTPAEVTESRKKMHDEAVKYAKDHDLKGVYRVTKDYGQYHIFDDKGKLHDAEDLEDLARRIRALASVKLNGKSFKIENASTSGSNEIALYLKDHNKIMLSAKQCSDLLAGNVVKISGDELTK